MESSVPRHSMAWVFYLALSTASAAGTNCDVLKGLAPGIWEPAFVYRSLDFHLSGVRYPPLNSQVELEGVCDKADSLKAQDFEWVRTTSDGGDWIASTTNPSVSLDVGGFACGLTGIAVTTVGAPSLRLQFDKCGAGEGKAALDVPLISMASGLKLVDWMCTVSLGSDLCAEAKRVQSNGTVPVDALPIQNELHLGAVLEAASKGITRVVAKTDCMDDLNWISVAHPIGVDAAEWGMLAALCKVLAPSSFPLASIPSLVQVQATCFRSCAGSWGAACGPAPSEKQPIEAVSDALPAQEKASHTGTMSADRLAKFGQALGDPETAPWLWLALFGAFFVGVVQALCCLPVIRGRQDVARVTAPRMAYPGAMSSAVIMR